MYKPSDVHIILLSVSEDVRKQRFNSRDQIATKEESNLNSSKEFRNAVMQAYRNIEDIVEIDTSLLSVTKVVEEILSVCNIEY
jgi:cytidylate kinase